MLGLSLPKNKRVTMSNWAARRLSDAQVRYAALDALVTGHVYRGLRLWHASPSACSACHQMLGEVRRGWDGDVEGQPGEGMGRGDVHCWLPDLTAPRPSAAVLLAGCLLCGIRAGRKRRS